MTGPVWFPPPSPPVIPDFELLRLIGQGAYGEVWLARGVTGVFRVIKVIRRDRFESERPFHRELEGISRFQTAVSGRPRQLALLHVGRNDDAGYFYYVMEPADDALAGSAIDPERYVPLTLKEALLHRGRIPAAECVQIALELTRGLAVLHDANLIHRDIKPSNIIFVQGVPKLADVGLVVTRESNMTFVGTFGYFPPEGPGSVTGDIYSLGKVLYEMATGLDREQFPRLPGDLVDDPEADLIGEVNAIFLHACHPDPAQRHASAHEMIRDLELVQAGKSVAFYEQIRLQLRAIAIAAGFLALAALVVSGFLVWRAGVVRRANEDIRAAFYRSDLAVAQLAKASGDLGRARAALLRQHPEASGRGLAGLEWHILAHEVRGEGLPLRPLTNGLGIRKLMTDSTGRWLAASFAEDQIGLVGLWDLYSGQPVRLVTNAFVLGGFTPDGLLVVDEPIRALRYEHPLDGPALRRDTGERLYNLLPNGNVLVVSRTGDFVFRILDINDNTVLREFNVDRTWQGYRVSVSDISSNGRYLAVGMFRESGARRERLLASIDLQQGTVVWSISPPAPTVWIKTSPNGSAFAANIGSLFPTVFSFADSNRQIRLSGHTARVQGVAFSGDGRYLATGGADQTVRVWDVRSGSLVSIHRGLVRPATSITWSNDGQHIFAGDDAGGIRVFQFPADQEPNEVSGFFRDVHGDLTFSPSSKEIAITATANSIAIVNTRDLGTKVVLTNVFQPIGISHDDSSIWAFSADWRIKQIDRNSKLISEFGTDLPEDFSVRSIAVSPSSQFAALSGHGGDITVFNLAIRRAFYHREPDSNTIWSIAYSSDSAEVWTGSASGIIRRRNAASGALLGDVATIDGEIQALALSPDGQWVAAALFADSSIRIWDRSRSKWLTALLTHRRFVQCLLFAPNGDRLISGGSDGRIVVWRVPEFEELATFELEQPTMPTGDEGIAALRLAPDLSALGALTEDGRLRVWRAN